MRALLCLVIVASCAILSGIDGQATSTSPTSTSPTTTTPSVNTTTTTTTTKRPIIRCHINCLQIYKPVCGFIDDRRRTFQNRCMLRGRRRCTNRKREAGYPDQPRIKYLHKGRCHHRTTRRKTTRRTTRVPIIG